MADVTWLGDADPTVDQITMYGHTFVKGKPTSIPNDDPYLGKLKGATNAFSTGKAKPDLVDEEDTPELAELKAELDRRNIKYRANASEESLWKALAEDDKAKAAVKANG